MRSPVPRCSGCGDGLDQRATDAAVAHGLVGEQILDPGHRDGSPSLGKRIAVSLVGVYIEATNDPPADRHARERNLRRAATQHALGPALARHDEQRGEREQPDDDRRREPDALGERAGLLDREQERPQRDQQPAGGLVEIARERREVRACVGDVITSR
jgi:hypothetical protein